MSMSNRPTRRWFQWSLRSLFLLMLVVAAFFAGYSLARKQAEAEIRRAAEEAREAAEEAREAQLQQARHAEAVARALEYIARQQAVEAAAKAIQP